MDVVISSHILCSFQRTILKGKEQRPCLPHDPPNNNNPSSRFFACMHGMCMERKNEREAWSHQQMFVPWWSSSAARRAKQAKAQKTGNWKRIHRHIISILTYRYHSAFSLVAFSFQIMPSQHLFRTNNSTMHSVNTSNNNTTAAPGDGGLLENSNNNRMVFPLSMVDLNNTALSYFLRGDYDHAVELFRMSLDLCHNRQEQTFNLQAAPTTSSTSSAAAAASYSRCAIVSSNIG